jgi:tetratricopeptide (TPR) repeat protein
LERKRNTDWPQALNCTSGNRYGHYSLGIALFDKGEKEEAIAHYRKVLEIKPDDALAHNNLGLALAKKGQVNEALLSYRQAIKINPHYADAYCNLGVALAQKGEIKQAIDCWQQALAIQPDQPIVQNNLAWLLASPPDASLRDGIKAVALAENANQLTWGRNPMVLHTLAAADAELGRYRDAAATARRARELAAAQKNGPLAAMLGKDIKLREAKTPMQHAPQ